MIRRFLLLVISASLAASPLTAAPKRISPLDAALQVLARSSSETAAEEKIVTLAPIEILRRLGGQVAVSVEAEGGPQVLPLLIDFLGEEKSLTEVGFRVQARLGTIWTGTLDVARLGDLAQLQGLRSAQLSYKLRATAAWNQKLSGDTSDGPALGVEQALAGAGVVVGIVDTGIDIWHEDFRNRDGSTRIKYLLDFSSPGDPDGNGILNGTGPFGGTLYTEAQLNQILRSGKKIAQKDTTGHGTHVASIAVGDDRTSPGMAPAANLIVVKATREPDSLDFWSIDLLNAMAFIDEKCTQLRRPCVINLSLGSLYGSHDGRSLEEQAIDALSGPGIPGRVFVVAAGNASDNRVARFRHFRARALAGISREHRLIVPAYNHPLPGQGNDFFLVSLWCQGEDSLTISLTAPDGSTRVTAPPGSLRDVPTPFGDVFISNLGAINSTNGDSEALILVDDASGVSPAAGDWTITIEGTEIGSTGIYDGWLLDNSQVGEVPPFLPEPADNEFLVGKPGTALHAITVGSYGLHAPGMRFRTSWTDVGGIDRVDLAARSGEISDFSSPGPTRDGRTKPELTAPGEWVLGAVSRDAFPAKSPHSVYRLTPFGSLDSLLVSARNQRALGFLKGTSFSAPVVTGLAARILGIDPALDAIQVRNVLLAAVQHDAATGDTPDPKWGYGKVDLTLGAVGGSLPPSLRVDTEELPLGIVGQPTGIILKASGGQPPYTWSQASGQLPPGLILADGRITGVPVSPGVFRFSIAVRDASPITQEAQRDLVVEVQAEPLFDIRIASFPPAKVGEAYEATLQVAGGRPPVRWELAGGLLPQGITFQGGILRGTPAEVGRFSFTARAIDSAGGEAFRSFTLHVQVGGEEAWSPLGELAPAVYDIAIDPNDSDHLVALTTGFNGVLIVESFDRGLNWNAISHNKGFYGSGVRLVFGPITSTIWLAGGGFPGIFHYDVASQLWKSPQAYCGDGTFIWINDLAFDRYEDMYVLAYNISCNDSSLDKYLAFLASMDGGQSWGLLSQFPPGMGPLYNADIPRQVFGSLAVSFPDARTIYATLGEHSLNRNLDRTFGSTDRGSTWLDIQGSSRWAGRILVSAKNPLDIVKAPPRDTDGTFDYIEKSVDGGRTWVRYHLPGVKEVCLLDRSLSDPSVLLAGTDQGALLSEDAGLTWKLVSGALFSDDFCGRRTLAEASVAIDPTDSNNLFVGTPGYGIWYSGDRGRTWSRRSYGLSHTSLSGIAISSANPDDFLAASSGDGPLVSRSGGKRWVVPTRPFEDPLYTDIHYFAFISPRDPLLFFIASQRDLFRSEDRGVSWQRIPMAPENHGVIGDMDVDPFDSNILLARMVLWTDSAELPSEIWRSDDRGSTWTRVGDVKDVWAPFMHDIESGLAFARDVEGRVYTIGEGGLFRSDDKGMSWRLYAPTNSADDIFFDSVVEPAPSNSEYVYVAHMTEIWSYNPAAGWRTFALPLDEISHARINGSNDFLSLAVDPNNPNVAFAGKGHPGVPGFRGGVFKTENGGRTWRRLNSPLDNFSVGGLSTDPHVSGIVVACTWEEGCFLSDDGGVTWRRLNQHSSVADNIKVVVQDPSDPQRLLAGTEGFGVQESKDGGRSFEAHVEGLGNFNINAIAFDPQTPAVVYAASDQGLYRSSDSGLTWSATALASGKITDLVLDTGARPRRVWLTSLGRGVGLTSNEGASFRFSSQGLASLDLTGIDLEVDGERKRLWVTTRGGDGVAYSDDLGLTWKSAAGPGLASRDVNDLLIEEGKPHKIWITTDDGVFYTNNAGLSWIEMSSGLPSGVPVTSITVDPQSGEAFVSLAAEGTGGIYRGGNLGGRWVPFSGGLEERKIQRITHGHLAASGQEGSVLYAATTGSGIYISPNLASLGQPPRITTERFPKGRLRRPFSVRLIANGGELPYAWTITNGSLPPGLALDRDSGIVSGKPLSGGFFSFTVRVSDAGLRSSERDFSVEIQPE